MSEMTKVKQTLRMQRPRVVATADEATRAEPKTMGRWLCKNLHIDLRFYYLV